MSRIEIAGVEESILDDEHHQVLGRVAAARVDEAERQAAHFEVGVAVEPQIRRYDARRFIDPRI